MKRQNNLLFIGVLLISVLFSGCSSVKKDLGFSRNSPDEFTVIKRAPLTLPPEYNIRPPLNKNSTDSSVIRASSQNRARGLLLGNGRAVIDNKGSADKLLMSKMNTNAADPDIRNLIDKDNGYLSLKNRSLVDKLVLSKNKEKHGLEELPISIVDPDAEAKRIKDNERSGKLINSGNVPIIEKKKSTLDKIF